MACPVPVDISDWVRWSGAWDISSGAIVLKYDSDIGPFGTNVEHPRPEEEIYGYTPLTSNWMTTFKLDSLVGPPEVEITVWLYNKNSPLEDWEDFKFVIKPGTSECILRYRLATGVLGGIHILATVPFDLEDTPWLRWRIQGGTLYWQKSVERNGPWTTMGSAPWSYIDGKSAFNVELDSGDVFPDAGSLRLSYVNFDGNVILDCEVAELPKGHFWPSPRGARPEPRYFNMPVYEQELEPVDAELGSLWIQPEG